MIPNFPPLLPGELINSALARFCDIFDLTSRQDLNRLALGGAAQKKPSIMAPPNLGRFASRLEHMTGDAMYDRHSLFPYYTAFLTPTERSATRNAVMSGDERAMRILGAKGKKLQLSTYLRFCRPCLEGDRLAHGVGYWHREHQLPGVLVCHRHSEPLEASEVPTIANLGLVDTRLLRRPLVSLEFALAVGGSKILAPPPDRIALLTDLARASAFLLNAPSADDRAHDRAIAFRHILSENGTITLRLLKGQLLPLVEAARKVWGNDIIGSLERWSEPNGTSEVPESNSTERMVSIFKLSRARRTLPYLLLLPVVGVAIEAVFEPQRAPTSPEAKQSAQANTVPEHRPGACVNPACSHGAAPLKLQPFDDTTSKSPYRCPHCGFTYAIVKVKWYQSRRIAETGSIWDAELVRLLDNPNTLIRQFVASLGCDQIYIKMRALAIGRWHARWTPATKAIIQVRLDKWRQGMVVTERAYDLKVLKAERKVWSDLRRAFPNSDKQGLAHRARRTQAYLRQHDAEWLKRNTPNHAMSRCKSAPPYDRARDEAHAAEAILAIDSIRRQDSKPRRLTYNSISDVMRKPHVVRRLNRNPLSQACFLDAIEDDDTWFRRKIIWHVEKLSREHDQVTFTQVRLQAALTNANANRYRDFIREALSKLPHGG